LRTILLLRAELPLLSFEVIIMAARMAARTLSIVALAAVAAATDTAVATTTVLPVADAVAEAAEAAAALAVEEVAEGVKPGVLGVTSKGMPCIDYTIVENPECYTNVTWAMETGIIENKTWYPEGTVTRADFQCALFLKFGNPGDPAFASHGCVMPPCTKVAQNMTSVNATTGLKQFRDVSNNCDKAPIVEKEEEASMPWWGIVLIVVGVLVVVVGGVVAAMSGGAKPKKKKRALAPPPPIPAKVEPLPTYTKVLIPVR